MHRQRAKWNTASVSLPVEIFSCPLRLRLLVCGTSSCNVRYYFTSHYDNKKKQEEAHLCPRPPSSNAHPAQDPASVRLSEKKNSKLYFNRARTQAEDIALREKELFSHYAKEARLRKEEALRTADKSSSPVTTESTRTRGTGDWSDDDVPLGGGSAVPVATVTGSTRSTADSDVLSAATAGDYSPKPVPRAWQQYGRWADHQSSGSDSPRQDGNKHFQRREVPASPPRSTEEGESDFTLQGGTDRLSRDFSSKLYQHFKDHDDACAANRARLIRSHHSPQDEECSASSVSTGNASHTSVDDYFFDDMETSSREAAAIDSESLGCSVPATRRTPPTVVPDLCRGTAIAADDHHSQRFAESPYFRSDRDDEQEHVPSNRQIMKHHEGLPSDEEEGNLHPFFSDDARAVFDAFIRYPTHETAKVFFSACLGISSFSSAEPSSIGPETLARPRVRLSHSANSSTSGHRRTPDWIMNMGRWQHALGCVCSAAAALADLAKSPEPPVATSVAQKAVPALSEFWTVLEAAFLVLLNRCATSASCDAAEAILHAASVLQNHHRQALQYAARSGNEADYAHDTVWLLGAEHFTKAIQAARRAGNWESAIRMFRRGFAQSGVNTYAFSSMKENDETHDHHNAYPLTQGTAPAIRSASYTELMVALSDQPKMIHAAFEMYCRHRVAERKTGEHSPSLSSPAATFKWGSTVVPDSSLAPEVSLEHCSDSDEWHQRLRDRLRPPPSIGICPQGGPFDTFLTFLLRNGEDEQAAAMAATLLPTWLQLETQNRAGGNDPLSTQLQRVVDAAKSVVPSPHLLASAAAAVSEKHLAIAAAERCLRLHPFGPPLSACLHTLAAHGEWERVLGLVSGAEPINNSPDKESLLKQHPIPTNQQPLFLSLDLRPRHVADAMAAAIAAGQPDAAIHLYYMPSIYRMLKRFRSRSASTARPAGSTLAALIATAQQTLPIAVYASLEDPPNGDAVSVTFTDALAASVRKANEHPSSSRSKEDIQTHFSSENAQVDPNDNRSAVDRCDVAVLEALASSYAAIRTSSSALKQQSPGREITEERRISATQKNDLQFMDTLQRTEAEITGPAAWRTHTLPSALALQMVTDRPQYVLSAYHTVNDNTKKHVAAVAHTLAKARKAEAMNRNEENDCNKHILINEIPAAPTAVLTPRSLMLTIQACCSLSEKSAGRTHWRLALQAFDLLSRQLQITAEMRNISQEENGVDHELAELGDETVEDEKMAETSSFDALLKVLPPEHPLKMRRSKKVST